MRPPADPRPPRACLGDRERHRDVQAFDVRSYTSKDMSSPDGQVSEMVGSVGGCCGGGGCGVRALSTTSRRAITPRAGGKPE